MPKSAQNILEEKLALVYEYNNNSPLFVRAAEVEMKKENLQKAVDILSDGLKKYPDYPTAYILLGKTFMMLGSYDKAEEAFALGAAKIGSKSTLDFYISEMENFRKKELSLYKNTPFISEDLENLLSQNSQSSSIIPGVEIVEEPIPVFDSPESKIAEPITAPDINGIKEEPVFEAKVADEAATADGIALPDNMMAADENAGDNDVDEKLADLAKEISFAKIKPDTDFVFAPDEPEDESISSSAQNEDENQFISETLANIYISQGKFKEALEVYKKLLIKQPENQVHLKSRIIEIESQLNGMDW